MVTAMVAEAKAGLHLDVLAARVKKAGFSFKNPAQVINLQLSKMGLVKSARGVVTRK